MSMAANAILYEQELLLIYFLLYHQAFLTSKKKHILKAK